MQEFQITDPSHELPIAERETIEIEGQINAFFDAQDASDNVSWGQALKLLESQKEPIELAISELREANEEWAKTVPRFPHYTRYSREQLLELNRHPYARTISEVEIAQILDAPTSMLWKAAELSGLEPIVHRIKGGTGKYIVHYARFTKDQIPVLKDALENFHPPTGYIAESKFLSVTKLAASALADIRKELGIDDAWFRNPETVMGERYLSPDQAKRETCKPG